jgi:3-oxoacyl-[acyl-carrier-protein] synthase-1
MADDPLIVGVGMMTAVGLTAPETAASVRAATMRFTETSIRDRGFDPITLAEVPDDGLPPLVDAVDRQRGLTAREIRMLRLGTMPLIEALAALPRGQRAPGLALALPEMQPGRRVDGTSFLQLFAAQTDSRFDMSRSAAVDEGRAGALIAIARAAQAIRSGQATFILAGAIDTYRDLYVLGTLDLEQRVKSKLNHDGFIPGEGAGFLLLASGEAAIQAGLKPLARLTRAALDEEHGHMYSETVYRGEGLARTLAQLFSSGDVQAPVAEVFSSMNGESHWAKEWGVGYIRNRSAFLEDVAIQHPADCFGDTGSACGPLLVGLAALGMRDGYRRSPSLVYCSSDRGPRVALGVSAALDA